MTTRTEHISVYGAIGKIHEMEEAGWAVRQVVPLVDTTKDLPGSFARDIIVVFEREANDG